MAAATVVVRAKNEAAGIERALRSLHAQSVRPEIIVVDSGSTDGTVALARPLCDRLIEIAPEEFSYGGALNLGTREAAAPFVFALSAHCVAHRPDWIERSLAHYRRPEVAGTNGFLWAPGGAALTEPFDQDLAHARAHPHWGFSNHASSWRREIWRRFPFAEELDYAEDREWALRVLAAGHVLVFDPGLWVDFSHAWKSPAEIFRRNLREARALRSFASPPPYGLRALAREWWREMPDSRHSRAFHRFANPFRMAGLGGKYLGYRLPPR